jgi:hypothetical protein
MTDAAKIKRTPGTSSFKQQGQRLAPIAASATHVLTDPDTPPHRRAE